MTENAFSQHLMSEKDLSPWEIRRRAMLLPVGKSPYNNSDVPAMPGLLHDMGNAFSLPKRVYEGSAAPDDVGENLNLTANLMGGGAAFPRPTSSLGVFGGPMPKGYRARNTGGGVNGNTNYQIEKLGWFGRHKPVGDVYVRDLGDNVQVGRININGDHRNKGIGTSLYGQIEQEFGKKLIPDSSLTDAAYNFWLKHRPEEVKGKYVKPEGFKSWMPREEAQRSGLTSSNPVKGQSVLSEQLKALDAILRTIE